MCTPYAMECCVIFLAAVQLGCIEIWFNCRLIWNGGKWANQLWIWSILQRQI